MFGKSKPTVGTKRKQSRLFFLAMTFALCLLTFSLVGGTLAWLMTETKPVVNVFTYGDIKITLVETTPEKCKMMPGKVIEKNPTLTVLADSEDCWLFVRIEESTDKALGDYIVYTVADGWMPLEGVHGVYYRTVDASQEDTAFSILKDNKVKVKDSVTKEMFESLNEENYPRMTFTGYAVQRDGTIDAIDSAAEAWALVSAG